jgi:hypothetical protein
MAFFISSLTHRGIFGRMNAVRVAGPLRGKKNEEWRDIKKEEGKKGKKRSTEKTQQKRIGIRGKRDEGRTYG